MRTSEPNWFPSSMDENIKGFSEMVSVNALRQTKRHQKASFSYNWKVR